MGVSDTGAGGSESVDRDRDGLRIALQRNEKLASELKVARSNLRAQKQETERLQKYLKQALADKARMVARGGGDPAELEAAQSRIAELERDLAETESDLTLLEDKVAEDQAARALDLAQLEALRQELAARDLRIDELEKGAGVDRARIAAQVEQTFDAELRALNQRIQELQAEQARNLGRIVELEEQLQAAPKVADPLPVLPPPPDDGRLAELEISLFQRDARIASLEAELAARSEVDPRLAELESTLAQRELRITKLEAVLAGRQMPSSDTSELEATLQERDALIAKFQSGARVTELEAQLAQRQARISKLEAALMKRGGALPDTEQLEARILELEAALAGGPAELNARISELESSLAVQAEVQNTLLQDAVKREARIVELEREKSMNAGRKEQLDGHMIGVSQLETELRQERARLAKLQGDAQLWLQGEKAARDAEIEQLKRLIAQRSHQEKEQSEQIAHLRQQVELLERQAPNGKPSAEVEQALARLAQVRAETQAALDREVARNDATVAELDKQLREVTGQLKAAHADRQAAVERVALREARMAELEHAVKLAGMRTQELEESVKRRDALLQELEQADKLTQLRAAELESALAQRDILIAGLEDQLKRTQKELEQVDALAESFESEMRQQIEDLQKQLDERQSFGSTNPAAFLESGASSWPDAP